MVTGRLDGHLAGRLEQCILNWMKLSWNWAGCLPACWWLEEWCLSIFKHCKQPAQKSHMCRTP